ncbi:MAG: biotin--[acetyl-CoA-carboxylase] ligase [Acutalibacteraceae bacterium]|nr:biotin--[acetyl-CoA-carboxylase] ligase [Clostridiales bacterium]
MADKNKIISNLDKESPSHNYEISPESIREHLLNYQDIFDFDVRKVVTSTNDIAKKLAHKGAKEGTVVISQEQTAGKGRRGKKFYSPADSGVYMSLILRPKYSANQSLFITVASAVAVARTVEKNSGKEAKIKWVNDVFCDDKKVSGILTESSFDAKNENIDFIVLGIGINIQEPKEGFPRELENIAISMFEENIFFDIKSKIIAQVLEEFWSFYLNLEEKNFLQEYKDRSILIGRQIKIINQDKTQIATVLEIDDECRLKVKMQNDEIKVLSSGEVSIAL